MRRHPLRAVTGGVWMNLRDEIRAGGFQSRLESLDFHGLLLVNEWLMNG